ncbi:serine protease [candidate division KSB1 bacterium]|nr:serine protease [candidate division KSB1 bacterium]
MFNFLKSTKWFCRFSVLGGASLWLCAFMLAARPASGQQESVVLINTEVGSGYGVAWGKSGNVVTALHLVAGRSKIFVKWKNQEVAATIEKIYQPADLALLRLRTPLNIPRLEIYPGDAPMDTPLNFWEAPLKMVRMNKKETKLDRAVPLERLDNRLEKNLAAFAKALCSDGQSHYPSLKTAVFKFEERNIKKAHSGSPLTLGNQIVGLIDGGPAINAKGSIWAIPAIGNFDKLLKEGSSAAPSRTCSSQRLYSGMRADNPHLDPELAGLANDLAASEENQFTFADDSGDRLSFAIEYRASCEEAYGTMFEEDQRFIRDLLKDEADFEDERVTWKDLLGQSIDIYQDNETGATIAVPTGSELRVEKEDGHTVVKVSSPHAGTTMIISVQQTNSVEESKAAKDWFQQYMVSDGREWVEEKQEEGEEKYEDDIEDYLNDPDEPYYSALIDRVVYDPDEESVVAELYASITIDENDFLGVVIKVNDWEGLTKAQRLYYYLLEACAILTDFAYY